MIEKREIYSKHFLNEDGTITALTYQTPIHFKDENGNLKEIDNSIVNDNNSLTTEKGIKEEEEFYTLKENPNLKIKFNKTTSDSDLIKLNSNNHEFNIGINNIKQTNAEIVNSQAENYVSKLSSAINYPNILDSVNLKINISSSNLLSEITLEEKTDLNSLSYNIETNLDYEITNDNTVIFKSEKEEIYILQTPYMYDKTGLNLETNVNVEEKENGYTIIYTFDKKWLENEERQYPITLANTIT